jgi:hypothetical protein
LPGAANAAIEYGELLEYERDPEFGSGHRVKPNGADRAYTVGELLDGVRQDSRSVTRVGGDADDFQNRLWRSASDGTPPRAKAADIFLSYAHEDRERIRPLVAAFEAEGWSVWWDRRIPAGGTFDEVIGERLEAARSVVVVWSHASVRKNWVKEEAEEGLLRGVLVPVLLEATNPPRGFRRIQAADLENWEGDAAHPAFRGLARDLAKLLGAKDSSR